MLCEGCKGEIWKHLNKKTDTPQFSAWSLIFLYNCPIDQIEHLGTQGIIIKEKKETYIILHGAPFTL